LVDKVGTEKGALMARQTLESQTILVVGGDIAGITAAVEAAKAGYDVVLLEKAASLGGRVPNSTATFPSSAVRPAALRSIINGCGQREGYRRT
jgi:heterodisulfide reductase subunit A-like polyferredoxin